MYDKLNPMEHANPVTPEAAEPTAPRPLQKQLQQTETFAAQQALLSPGTPTVQRKEDPAATTTAPETTGDTPSTEKGDPALNPTLFFDSPYFQDANPEGWKDESYTTNEWWKKTGQTGEGDNFAEILANVNRVIALEREQIRGADGQTVDTGRVVPILQNEHQTVTLEEAEVLKDHYVVKADGGAGPIKEEVHDIDRTYTQVTTTFKKNDKGELVRTVKRDVVFTYHYRVTRFFDPEGKQTAKTITFTDGKGNPVDGNGRPLEANRPEGHEPSATDKKEPVKAVTYDDFLRQRYTEMLGEGGAGFFDLINGMIGRNAIYGYAEQGLGELFKLLGGEIGKGGGDVKMIGDLWKNSSGDYAKALLAENPAIVGFLFMTSDWARSNPVVLQVLLISLLSTAITAALVVLVASFFNTELQAFINDTAKNLTGQADANDPNKSFDIPVIDTAFDAGPVKMKLKLDMGTLNELWGDFWNFWKAIDVSAAYTSEKFDIDGGLFFRSIDSHEDEDKVASGEERYAGGHIKTTFRDEQTVEDEKKLVVQKIQADLGLSLNIEVNTWSLRDLEAYYRLATETFEKNKETLGTERTRVALEQYALYHGKNASDQIPEDPSKTPAPLENLLHLRNTLTVETERTESVKDGENERQTLAEKLKIELGQEVKINTATMSTDEIRLLLAIVYDIKKTLPDGLSSEQISAAFKATFDYYNNSRKQEAGATNLPDNTLTTMFQMNLKQVLTTAIDNRVETVQRALDTTITFNYAEMSLSDITLVFKLMYEIADAKKIDKDNIGAEQLGILQRYNTTRGVFLNGTTKFISLSDGGMNLSALNMELGYYHKLGYYQVVEVTAQDGSQQRMLLQPFTGGWNFSMLYNQQPNAQNAALLDQSLGLKAGVTFTFNQYDQYYQQSGSWDFNAALSYMHNFSQPNPGLQNLSVNLTIRYSW